MDAPKDTNQLEEEKQTATEQAEETVVEPTETAAKENQDVKEASSTEADEETTAEDNSENVSGEENTNEENADASASEPPEETEESEPEANPEATEKTQDAAAEDTSTTSADTEVDFFDFLASSDAHWYVVHTYSGHETKVSQALKQRVVSMRLEDKILDILVPTQEKIEVRKGKKEQFKEKIFPGYILVRMIVDDYSWLAVRTTPGVTGFVGAGNKPTPIPDEEVKAIQKFMAMEAPKYKAVFSVGEAVKIIEGPFTEFLGTVDNIDEAKGKIKVLVSIFGRETPVELDFLQVSKL